MHSKCQDNKTSTFDITGTVEMVHMFYINNNIVCLFLQVPVKYICGICRNPRHGRQSVLYSIDQDWLKEGRLPSTSSSTSGRLPAPPPRHLSRACRPSEHFHQQLRLTNPNIPAQS